MEAGQRLHIGSFGNEGVLRGRQILVPEGENAKVNGGVCVVEITS